ncbi:MAG: hypothetical protein H6921_14750 [Sphingomonas sp.]|nr:hypothetical protein [Sphingomonas sp.]
MSTNVTMIGAWLGELIDAHMLKCNEAFPHPDDCPPHIICEVHGTKAYIERMSIADLSIERPLVIELNDGTSFAIHVQEI